MAPLDPLLPAEVMLKVSAYLDSRDLAALCATSREMHARFLPKLYEAVAPGSMQGCLSLLRRLNEHPNEGYIGHFGPTIRELYIASPEKAAAAKVSMKAAIAQALGVCIEDGRLPALQVLKWPFTRIPHFVAEPESEHWDERLWDIILRHPTYPQKYVRLYDIQ